MMATLKSLHLLALAVWLGAMVFFSFVAAPALFSALPREAAGRAVAAIFPRYYALGAACGAAAFVTLLPFALRAAGGRRALAGLVLLAAMVGLTLFARQAILPRARAAREAVMVAAEGSAEEAAARARFAAIHRRSAALNGTVIVLGVVVLLLAASLNPRPGGGP